MADDVTVPPFAGEPEPESEPRLKTAEKILVRSKMVVLIDLLFLRS